MLLLLALQLAAPDAATLMNRAATRLATPAPAADPADRYRVESDDVVVDGKRRALQTTGEQCQVVGARMCTRPPRTWLKAELPK